MASALGMACGIARGSALVVTLCAWLPLFVLTLLDGRAWSGVQVPYLLDAEVHARLLIALPLLVVAERTVHEWLRGTPRKFIERQIVPSAARPALDCAVRSAERLRDRVLPETVLLAFIYSLGVIVSWRSTGPGSRAPGDRQARGPRMSSEGV